MIRSNSVDANLRAVPIQVGTLVNIYSTHTHITHTHHTHTSHTSHTYTTQHITHTHTQHNTSHTYTHTHTHTSGSMYHSTSKLTSASLPILLQEVAGITHAEIASIGVDTYLRAITIRCGTLIDILEKEKARIMHDSPLTSSPSHPPPRDFPSQINMGPRKYRRKSCCLDSTGNQGNRSSSSFHWC